MDAPNSAGANGTQLQIYDCHTNGTVTNGANNLCLSVTGTANTAGVTIATCNGRATQRWTRS